MNELHCFYGDVGKGVVLLDQEHMSLHTKGILASDQLQVNGLLVRLVLSSSLWICYKRYTSGGID